MSNDNVKKIYKVIIGNKTYRLGHCSSLNEAINKFKEKYPNIDLDANHAEINVQRITW